MRKYMDKFSNLLNEAKKPKKMVKENMSLGDFPHITADENGIEALQNDESQVGYGEMSLYEMEDLIGKIEVYGNKVYYDENDSEVMIIMKIYFPEQFGQKGDEDYPSYHYRN